MYKTVDYKLTIIKGTVTTVTTTQHLTLMMTLNKVVKTSVTTIDDSPSQDYSSC